MAVSDAGNSERSDAQPRTEASAAALRAAIGRAQAASPWSQALLDTLAYLAPRRIPIAILSPTLLDESQRREAVTALVSEKLAVIEKLDGDVEGISIATALQDEMRRNLAASGEDEICIARTLRIVTDAYPPGAAPAAVENWSLCERLNQHAYSVLAHSPDGGDVAHVTSDLLHRLSHYLFARGRYEEVEPIVRRSGAIDELLHGPDHAHLGQDRTNLAILLYEMGRTEEALPHIRRAMAIGEASWGPEHPVVAERYNILATMLESLGRPAEADPFIRHALLAAELTLGKDHPETVVYRENYERIVSAIDRMAVRDDAVEAGLQPAPPERLARRDIPPPPVSAKRGMLGRLLKGKR